MHAQADFCYNSQVCGAACLQNEENPRSRGLPRDRQVDSHQQRLHPQKEGALRPWGWQGGVGGRERPFPARVGGSGTGRAVH